MTHVDVAIARCLTTAALVAALASSACATARPAGSSPPVAPTAAPAPAPATQKPGTSAAASAGAAAASPGGPQKPIPRRTAVSRDGTRIVYEVEGTGPALLLVHGGGQTGRSWTERGYVEKLRDRFTVITMDLRGGGESGRPAVPDAYALDRHLEDFAAVADAAKAPRFHLWGFGHGATIGRYLAARSDRVISAVLVGATLGPALEGVVKDAILGMRAKWLPLIQQQMAGTLKVDALSNSDRTAFDAGVAVSALALGAMVDYPPLEPSEIKVPTLWLIGAADTSALENVKAYEGKLAGTKVTLKLLSGASYTDSFGKSELSLAEAVPFLTSGAPTTTSRSPGVAMDPRR
jgi:pimeloyl-ACP methyl ester carboxylesterase